MSFLSRPALRFFPIIYRNIHTSCSVLHFQSAISLNKLYAKSNLDITKKIEPPRSNDETFSGYIPMNKLVISYSKSSGPGGQNVQKVNTKVDLRFNLKEADWLSQSIKDKVYDMYKTSLTVDGVLVLRSDKTRSQQLNLADALDKLRGMLHTATYMPPPPQIENVERARRRHEAASRERLRQKKHRSSIKKDRQAPDY